MVEGSRSGSGSIPLTNGTGSGSRRPKNMWIRWIRIRIRNIALISVVDRHRFDADPDQTFQFWCRSGSFPKFYFCWKIRGKNWLSAVSVYILFYYSCQHQRCQNFQYFRQYTIIFWEKYSLALHLVEMDTDPDRQTLDTYPDLPKWPDISDDCALACTSATSCYCSIYNLAKVAHRSVLVNWQSCCRSCQWLIQSETVRYPGMGRTRSGEEPLVATRFVQRYSHFIRTANVFLPLASVAFSG